MSSKRFHIAEVLSIATQIALPSPGREYVIEGIHAVLDHMCGRSIFTHEFPEAYALCRPALLKQFPIMSDPVFEWKTQMYRRELSHMDDDDKLRQCENITFQMQVLFGLPEFVDVEALPEGAWKSVSIEEAFGKKPVLRVDLPAVEEDQNG
ncbi:MAG: hypothetical protein ABFD60_04370 [Bryobacteraceae bacterium]